MAEAALRATGVTSPVRGVEAVKSGYGSRAFQVRTRERAYFLTWSGSRRCCTATYTAGEMAVDSIAVRYVET